jgi:S-formylglutathione hydrolase FrmB
MARRFVAFVLAVLVLALLPAADAATVCRPPRCRDVRVPVPKGLRVPDSRVRILLPEGYGSGRARYPVVFLLHGAGDTYATWSQNTDVVSLSRRYRAIIVMPDGGHGSEAGWYSDWKDGSRQWETFHTKVLIRYIDTQFRTRGAGHRAVAGLSMGGFGAMSYAARHKDLFRAAASFSGAVDTMYLAPGSGVAFTAAHNRFGTPDDRVWGNQTTEMDAWRAHNPTDRAPDLAGKWLFVATGTGTPGGPAGDDPSNPGGYGIEHGVFHMNMSFARALDGAAVPFTSDFYTGGYHDWPYWERELHLSLPQLV